MRALSAPFMLVFVATLSSAQRGLFLPADRRRSRRNQVTPVVALNPLSPAPVLNAYHCNRTSAAQIPTSSALHRQNWQHFAVFCLTWPIILPTLEGYLSRSCSRQQKW